jgi:Fic family protein
MEAKFFELDAKMDAVRATMNRFPQRVLEDYQGKLDVSWIFHDHALEGVVLSYSELKAAIDQRIISDVSLIPMYEEVKNHKVAVDFIRETLQAKKPPIVDLELIRKIYGILTPEAIAKGCPYRKENPLHRLYYHEIAPPEKIGYKMRKIEEWLESSEFTSLHPIAQATRLQFKILTAYPWTKNSGKVARLAANYILIRAGYLPAVVHSIERQRYYEVLRHENDGLLNLVIESLENSIDTTSTFFRELANVKVKRAS